MTNIRQSFQIEFSFRLNYKTDDLHSATPDLSFGNGDGTVNERSLKGCTYWRNYQDKPISTLEVQGGEHFEILSNQKVVDYVVDVMFK